MSTPVQLSEEDFKMMTAAVEKLQQRGMEIQTSVRQAEVMLAQAKLDAQVANQQMRGVVGPLGARYGFDPDVPYTLDYATRSLVPKG
jgi:S-methylmethionine-dependent homocysteine/selenocysteine methylase